MREAKLLSRTLKDSDVPVICGIGHRVKADVYTAVFQHRDMDGEPMTPWEAEVFEPDTCVVCGLKLWHRA